MAGQTVVSVIYRQFVMITVADHCVAAKNVPVMSVPLPFGIGKWTWIEVSVMLIVSSL